MTDYEAHSCPEMEDRVHFEMSVWSASGLSILSFRPHSNYTTLHIPIAFCPFCGTDLRDATTKPGSLPPEVQQAIREGVREGLEPLSDLAARLKEALPQMAELSARLKRRQRH